MLQHKGELFSASESCQDPGGSGGDAEDDKDASETSCSISDG